MIIDFENLFSEMRHPLRQCDDLEYKSVFHKFQYSELYKKLLPFQVPSTVFLSSRSSAILADDMGLGKTRCSIVSILFQQAFPCLIICKSGDMLTWKSEIQAVTSIFPVSIFPDDEPSEYGFTIIGYSMLCKIVKSRYDIPYQSCIIDEAHLIKNSSKLRKDKLAEKISNGDTIHRTSSAFHITKTIPKIYCLTGTPILSRPSELYNLLAITRHTLGKNYLSYTKQYCNGHAGPFGWISDGASNISELKYKLKGHIIRRLKRDVINLPPKSTYMTALTLSQEGIDEYRGSWNSYLNYIRDTKSTQSIKKALDAQHIIRLNLLRQICSRHKVDSVFARAVDYFKDGHKVIFFTHFKSTMNLLINKLKSHGYDYAIYAGAIDKDEKYAEVVKFQTNPKCMAFIGILPNAGTSITLTAAKAVMTIDFSYVPSDHSQADDRHYRIGQDHEVDCHYYYFKDTIEEGQLSILSQKRKIIEAILNDASVGDIFAISIKKEMIEIAKQSSKQYNDKLCF